MKKIIIFLVLFSKIGTSQDTLAFQLLNQYRAYYGKPALEMNTSFAKYAIDLCDEMMLKDSAWHPKNRPSNKECVGKANGKYYIFKRILEATKWIEKVFNLDTATITNNEFAIGYQLYGYDNSPPHKKILLANDNANGYFHINISKIEKRYCKFAKLTYYNMTVNNCINIDRK